MAQSFLGPNPGTVVKDALEPELVDLTGGNSIADDTVVGDWVEVNFPACVAVVAELGSITAGAAVEIEVQGADADDATGLVSYGRFAAIDGDNDGEMRVLVADVYKPLMRAVVSEANDSAAEVRVVVRPKDFWQGSGRTA